MIAAGRRVRVMPQLKVEQGIQAARTIFGKCFFDTETCQDGIQALRHYRYAFDEKLKGRKEPLHDQYSYAADAFRTAAVMIREPERKNEQKNVGRWGSDHHGANGGHVVAPQRKTCPFRRVNALGQC